MEIALICALADNRVIGRDNQLPWRLPADLRHFKQVTMGKPVVMGRRTYESIGKPLPGRTNIVLTRAGDFAPEGVLVAHDFDQAIAHAEQLGAEQCMIIGGAEIYALALPLAKRLYLTHVHADVDGDAHFPSVMWGDWREVKRESFPAGDGNEAPFSISEYERVVE